MIKMKTFHGKRMTKEIHRWHVSNPDLRILNDSYPRIDIGRDPSVIIFYEEA